MQTTVAAILLTLASVAALAQAPAYRARLSPMPLDVAMQSTIAGSGSVTATLKDKTLSISGTFSGLKTPATLARVHRAPKGMRGEPIFDLTVSRATEGTISGSLTLTDDQLKALTAHELYIQLHSEKAPEGNLWGWLLPQDRRK